MSNQRPRPPPLSQDAVFAILDAERTAKHWRAQGQVHWAATWDAYANAIPENRDAFAHGKLEHPSTTCITAFDVDINPYRRPSYLQGVSIL